MFFECQRVVVTALSCVRGLIRLYDMQVVSMTGCAFSFVLRRALNQFHDPKHVLHKKEQYVLKSDLCANHFRLLNLEECIG